MTSEELPPALPDIVVDAGLGHTAEGDQVAAPWTQVWLCAVVGAGRWTRGWTNVSGRPGRSVWVQGLWSNPWGRG